MLLSVSIRWTSVPETKLKGSLNACECKRDRISITLTKEQRSIIPIFPYRSTNSIHAVASVGRAADLEVPEISDLGCPHTESRFTAQLEFEQGHAERREPIVERGTAEVGFLRSHNNAVGVILRVHSL
jgi:hypothetical protein